jgi:maleate isomerase
MPSLAATTPALRRVGLIIPSSNRMVEQEMVHHYPPGVIVHVNRLRMTGAQKVPLPQLMPRVVEAAAALADAQCEVITFHCTANSTDDGTEGEAAILAALRKGGARRASSTATAVRRALAEFSARRIVLVTPYSQAVTDHEAEFFKGIGVDVLTAKGYALPGSDAYCAALPAFWREKALAARHRDADLYFLSCANISAFSVIADLERELGRPVISSNQVVVWDQLAADGLALPAGQRGECPGSLLAKRC